ncbi:hypothetical protein DsansV1_C14g0130671 [Dioscorea sansibarensis]
MFKCIEGKYEDGCLLKGFFGGQLLTKHGLGWRRRTMSIEYDS